ncbi:MAG: biotin synthase BioB, partial [Candidatus Binatia bacterium]
MNSFSSLAERSLAGAALSHEEASTVLQSEDGCLPELLRSAFAVRQRFFGRKVKVCVLQNARSGICPE